MIVEPPGVPRTYATLVRRNRPPFVVTMVGVIAESGRLPGAIEFAGPWIRPIHVGHAHLGGEVVHLIIHKEAKALHRDARAEGAVERVSVGDGIAVGVDDREVGGLGRLVHRRLKLWRSRHEACRPNQVRGRRWRRGLMELRHAAA